MDNQIIEMGKQLGGDDFWQRPEGKLTKKLGFPLLLIGGAIGLYKILPFIITLLENTLYTIFLGLVLALVVFLLTNKQIRYTVSYAFQAIMRGLVGLIIDLDPVAFLKGLVQRLKKREEVVETNKGKLRGRMRDVADKIKAATKEMNISRQLAQAAYTQAQEEGGLRFKLTYRSSARKAMRRRDRIITFKEMYRMMEVLFRGLEKLQMIVRYYVEDIEDEVEDALTRRETMNSAYLAYMAARGVLSENSEEAVKLELGLKRLADDYNSKFGQIEEFLSMASDMINGFDLQNMTLDAHAVEMFERWEKEGDDIVLGTPTKLAILNEADDISDIIDFDRPTPALVAPPPEKPSTKYRNLIFGAAEDADFEEAK